MANYVCMYVKIQSALCEVACEKKNNRGLKIDVVKKYSELSNYCCMAAILILLCMKFVISAILFVSLLQLNCMMLKVKCRL